MFGLPSQEAVFEAARELNQIAYSTGPGEHQKDGAVGNVRALENIARLLKIKTGYA
jgi:hypothetical protein